jgi:RNA polymerase sigma-70 factor (ECF subfamily)
MTFMRAYQDMVFTTAARLTGNDAQAEDIAQDVFVRAFEHFPQLKGSPTAGGWLKTVATNLTLNYLTRYRRRRRLFSEVDDEFDDVPASHSGGSEMADPPLDDLGAEQRRTLIDEALRGLPEHQRVPLVLFHFEELSYQEIADALGVSLAKVKTDIRRARAALLQRFESTGLVRESW